MDPDVELRCANGQLHGILKGDLIEVHCKNNRCKLGRPNTVVLHYYDSSTGVLKDTKFFDDPVGRLRK